MEFAGLPWDFEREMGHRPAPKTGSAVHYSVTAFSVKKAFMYPTTISLSHREDRECRTLMLPAHTARKCESVCGLRVALAAPKRNSKRDCALKKSDCRSPARFELFMSFGSFAPVGFDSNPGRTHPSQAPARP